MVRKQNHAGVTVYGLCYRDYLVYMFYSECLVHCPCIYCVYILIEVHNFNLVFEVNRRYKDEIEVTLVFKGSFG